MAQIRSLKAKSTWEEAGLLSEEDRVKRCRLKGEWNDLLRLEEVEWRQKSRAIWLREGDNNTKYFHKVANQRRRINKIVQLEVEGEEEIKKAMVEHFSGAFRKQRGWCPLWVDEELGRIPDQCLQSLEARFTEKEVKEVIFGAEVDKAPGPDGFGLQFFQEFWEAVKDDIMEMFDDFFSSLSGIGSINATFLALIPKKEGASTIGDFRPISLVNGCYKMISKVLANRIKEVIGHLVDGSQTTFIPGRLLQDGFMTVQECISGVNMIWEARAGVQIGFREGI
ncbi:hypothetical protein QJS10_CPB21g01155 [Acorus calamus]|uniref:Reverse transcriptase domain-containing protein n=1 Tax=Acorus calamus TaxID=4465 RepID=A0AAV9C649_ACOCL|nr:hypothetical protein QJS10_CPB21g01155 [Acorus calamus]